MGDGFEFPTQTEVADDLKCIRTMDWSQPEPFAGLRALYDLVPRAGRPARSDAERVRDALSELLNDLIRTVRADERQHPPKLGNSIADAGEHLLKLRIPEGIPQVHDLYERIAENWRWWDKTHGKLREVSTGTFVNNHMSGVYDELARRLLSSAAAPVAAPNAALEQAIPVSLAAASSESQALVDEAAPGDPIRVDVPTGGDVDGLLAGLAYDLGVRRSPGAPAFAVPVDTSTKGVRLSRYVTREALDEPVRVAIHRTFTQPGVHVIALHGFSYTGKSRALLQALLDQQRSFRFLAPQSASQLSALLDGPLGQTHLHVDRPTMLWIDPLERFAGPTNGAWWGARLEQHATRRAPLVLLTGLGGTAGVPSDTETREFLQLDHPLDRLRDLSASSHLTLVEIAANERGFATGAALAEIRGTYDAMVQRQPGPWEAAARDGGFLRALAHGRQLERRYLSGEPDPASIDPRGQAVAWAVMAWRRAVERDDPVDVETIERLAEHSPLGSRGHIGSEAELHAAIKWACRQATSEGASSLIRPARHIDGTQAFYAEGFLAQALVEPHEITAPAWAIIEAAAPASRLAIVRGSTNVSAIRAHGRVSQAAGVVDVDLRRSVVVRGPDESGAGEDVHVVGSAAFRTDSGFEGRLQAVDYQVEIVLWSTPVGSLTATTVAVRLAPAAPGADHTQALLPIVVIGHSDDGYWQILTDLAAPRTDGEWRTLTESVRVATISQ